MKMSKKITDGFGLRCYFLQVKVRSLLLPSQLCNSFSRIFTVTGMCIVVSFSMLITSLYVMNCGETSSECCLFFLYVFVILFQMHYLFKMVVPPSVDGQLIYLFGLSIFLPNFRLGLPPPLPLPHQGGKKKEEWNK